MRFKIAVVVCLVTSALSGPGHTQDKEGQWVHPGISKMPNLMCYRYDKILCYPRSIPDPSRPGGSVTKYICEYWGNPCVNISRSEPTRRDSDDPWQKCVWQKLRCENGTCLYGTRYDVIQGGCHIRWISGIDETGK
jgi:hypothetical protein